MDDEESNLASNGVRQRGKLLTPPSLDKLSSEHGGSTVGRNTVALYAVLALLAFGLLFAVFGGGGGEAAALDVAAAAVVTTNDAVAVNPPPVPVPVQGADPAPPPPPRGRPQARDPVRVEEGKASQREKGKPPRRATGTGDLQSPECLEKLRDGDMTAEEIARHIKKDAVVLFGSRMCPCSEMAQSKLDKFKVCREDVIWADSRDNGGQRRGYSNELGYLMCVYGSENHSFVFINGKFIGNGFIFGERRIQDRPPMDDEELKRLLAEAGAEETCEPKARADRGYKEVAV